MALTKLTKIDKAEFIKVTAEFLKQWENPKLIGDSLASSDGGIHNDSKNIPTVGYGINIKAMSYSNIERAYKFALTGKIDGQITSVQASGLKIIETWKSDKTPTLAEDLSLIAKSNGTGGTKAEQKALNSLWLTDAQASKLLEAKINGLPGLFSGSIEKGLAARLKDFGATVPADSQEKLVLFSLYYNSPSLIGPGIANAIKTDNHAKFWYEVRYNHDNFSEKGLQNRRETESNKVGILGLSDRKDPDAVLKAMDFLFDRTGGATSVYEKIAARDKVINAADKADATKQSFEAQVASSLKILSDKHADGQKIHFVQVGGSGDDNFAAGVASYAKFDAKANRTETNTNDLVIAGDGNNTVKSGGGDDWVYSGKGNDTVELGNGDDFASTGAGDDVLNGGDGADIMNGGKGYDTYFVDDVFDKVIDSDKGMIKTEISLKSMTKNIDTYVNLKAGLTHTLKIDVAKLPANQEAGLHYLEFDGSSGKDTYRFSLPDDDVLLYLKTGTGSDTVAITGRDNPETGLTTIFVEDASGSDRFDISAFNARSLEDYEATADDVGGFFYSLLKTTGLSSMAVWYAFDDGSGTVELNNSFSISSIKSMSDSMFIV